MAVIGHLRRSMAVPGPYALGEVVLLDPHRGRDVPEAVEAVFRLAPENCPNFVFRWENSVPLSTRLAVAIAVMAELDRSSRGNPHLRAPGCPSPVHVPSNLRSSI